MGNNVVSINTKKDRKFCNKFLFENSGDGYHRLKGIKLAMINFNEIEPIVGETIQGYAKRAINFVKYNEIGIVVKFNGIELDINENSTIESIIDDYHNA